MEENKIQSNIWNTAAKAGLILGLVSTAYLFISQWISPENLESSSNPRLWAIMRSFLTIILWLCKTGGCIWIMHFFMKKYILDDQEATNKDTFRLGVAMALLSALVYSAVTFANVAYINADMIAEQMEVMMNQMAPLMDSNTSSLMDSYLENLPQITFVTNLLYCFIYGTILSFILSRNIPQKDPFADYKPIDKQ